MEQLQTFIVRPGVRNWIRHQIFERVRSNLSHITYKFHSSSKNQEVPHRRKNQVSRNKQSQLGDMLSFGLVQSQLWRSQYQIHWSGRRTGNFLPTTHQPHRPKDWRNIQLFIIICKTAARSWWSRNLQFPTFIKRCSFLRIRLLIGSSSQYDHLGSTVWWFL